MKVIIELNGERHELIECILQTCVSCTLNYLCQPQYPLCQTFKERFKIDNNVMFVLETYNNDYIKVDRSICDQIYNYQDILEVIKNKFI